MVQELLIPTTRKKIGDFELKERFLKARDKAKKINQVYRC